MHAFHKGVEYHLRLAERLPLGTPYQQVVDRIVQLTRLPHMAGKCHLTVDGDGGGATGGGDVAAGRGRDARWRR